MEKADLRMMLIEQALLWWGVLSACVVSIPIWSFYLGDDEFARQFAWAVRGGSVLGVFLGIGMFAGIFGIGTFVRNIVKQGRKLLLVRTIPVILLCYMMSFLGQHM